MSWLNLTKVLSGFVLAIAVVIGGGYLVAQFLVAQFTAPPPKPVFPNDAPGAKARVQVPAPAKPVAAKPSPSPSPSASASPTPSPQPSPSPPGYTARINLSQGLNIRSAPSRDANRIGGVTANDRITVLEESPNGEWQRIRVAGSGLEGWIKAGYAERLNQ